MTQRAAIAAMGRVLGSDVLRRVHDLYRAEQEALAGPPTAADLAYGAHERQRLDLYAPDAARGAPVLVWVHGGGFIRGEKRSGDHPYNAHAGRWAAANGMLGAVINYRLAPDATWPAGAEDVTAAVEWLRNRASDHGGDPDRIIPMGTSAGAVHIAAALRLSPDLPVRAAVLLSGLYGFTSLDQRDALYYGDPALYHERMPLKAVVETAVPLFVASAEFDPPRFQAETLGLLAARLERHGTMPRAYVAAGHNHFSIAYHLGTADTRLADEVLGFIREQTGEDS